MFGRFEGLTGFGGGAGYGFGFMFDRGLYIREKNFWLSSWKILRGLDFFGVVVFSFGDRDL